MITRTTRLLTAAAALVLGLTACTGGAPGSTGQQQQTTGPEANSIRYLIEQPEDPTTFKLIQAHLKTFEQQNPGVTVKLEQIGSDNMRTVLQTQLRSGEGPDVFSWGSGPGYAGALAKAGLLYDLTGAYAKYKWPVYDFAKQRVTFNGKIYGIPGEMETIGLFYNKDMFAAAGLSQPKNLADLEAAAKVFKAKSIIPIAVNDKEGWQGGHLLSMALSSAIGSKGMDALLTGKTSWNSPEVVNALNLWKSWQSAGYLPTSPTSITADSGAALFYAGKAAVLPTGSWAIPAIEKNAKFKAGYIPFPAASNAGIFTGGLGSGPFISASSKKVDADLKLMNFLASPEHGRWTVEKLGTIPAYPVDTKGIKTSPLFTQVLNDTSKFSRGGDFGYNIDVLETDTFNKAMWDGVQGLLSGQKTADQVAASLDKAANTK